MKVAKDRGALDSTLAAMFSNPDYRSNYLFYAHMIGQCSIRIKNDLKAPAGVAFKIDHYDLYINPALFDVYPLKERLFILQHEMHHILGGHVSRKEHRVHKPWNFATDCAINQLGDKNHRPENCVYPETLAKMLGTPVPEDKHGEYYYDMIKDKIDEEKEKQKGEGSGQPGEGDPEFGEGEGDPELLDDHDIWEETAGDPELQADQTKKMIEKAQNETVKGRGDIPGGFSDWLAMHTRKSEMNWKKILRGIVGNKRVGTRSTIMRNDRRFPKRADLRGKTKDRVFNLLVVGDVSGSMSDEAVLTTLGEVRHICDVTKTAVDLIQVDAKAYPPEKLTKKMKLVERKGRGGTRLYPAIELAREHRIEFQAVVVLTDGGVGADDIEKFEKLNMKVIWLIEETGHIMDEMNKGRMMACKLTGTAKNE